MAGGRVGLLPPPNAFIPSMAVKRLSITLTCRDLPTSLHFTDRVFNSGTKTMEVYDEVAKDIVLAAMDGERVTSPATRAHTPHLSLMSAFTSLS
jgi:hypothetical protein